MNEYPQIKHAVGQAFKELRRQGFIARQSFLCCWSCAGAALDTPENQGKSAVYYTRQDLEDFERCGQVYLAYGMVGDFDAGTYQAVGGRVVQAMTEQGLETEWDGSATTRILVKGFLPLPAPATYLDLVGETA